MNKDDEVQFQCLSEDITNMLDGVSVTMAMSVLGYCMSVVVSQMASEDRLAAVSSWITTLGQHVARMDIDAATEREVPKGSLH